MTTKISAGRTVKLMPCWITTSPYAMSRSTTEIRGRVPWSAGAERDVAITASQAQHVEDQAEEPVRDDGEDDRRHHRRRGGEPDGRGAATRLHAAQAAGQRDQDPEDA